MRLSVFSILGCLFLALSCFAQGQRYIRVNIIPDAASLNLSIDGFFEIIDPISKVVLYRGKNLRTTVAGYRDGILMGEINLNRSKVLLHPNDIEALIINGRRFRGDIQLIRKESLRLLVINYVDVEDYIKGILYHETSHYWPLEALKAQAIACRSYAFYQIGENSSGDYDVTSDIYSQVYGGRTSERYRTTKAVEQTKGQVLTYRGKIFPAYYHATCAGHTADASSIWKTDMPPLKGVVCNFCKDSPHLRWHQVLSFKTIEEKLAASDYRIKKIRGFRTEGKDESGRITRLKIIGENKTVEMPAKDFRSIIGPNIIRSTNFSLQIIGPDVIFEGLGWGHGVGLCQWGAYFMAKQGYNYEEILKYYYPQTDVKALGF